MPNFTNGTIKIIDSKISIPSVADNALIALPCHLDGDFDASNSNILVSQRFPVAKTEFRLWFRSQLNFKLDQIKIITLSPSIQCAFLLSNPPSNDHIYPPLKSLSNYLRINKLSLHMTLPSSEINKSNLINSINELIIPQNINAYLYKNI